MSNMSYCRFRNTETDLEDCYASMENGDELSHEEAEARKRLIERCVDIALDYGHEVGRAVEEV
jgi:hypothetical protein